MYIALHMRVFAAVLLLALAAQGQPPTSSEPNTLRSEQSGQSANQNTSPSPLTQTGAQEVPSQNVQQQMPVQSGAPSTPANSSSPEIKESFSQLTLFLFGSGLALFIALLAWSDQIRGIDKDTKELEQRFLEKTGINKRDFLNIVKPESADEQLVALTQVVSAGRIETRDTAEVLRTFPKWNSQWSRIERLSAWKYNLTILLTLALFVAGIASLFTTPMRQINLRVVSVRVEMFILILPVTLIALLFIIIICSARLEKALRSLLNSMSDRV